MTFDTSRGKLFPHSALLSAMQGKKNFAYLSYAALLSTLKK